MRGDVGETVGAAAVEHRVAEGYVAAVTGEHVPGRGGADEQQGEHCDGGDRRIAEHKWESNGK